MSKSLRKAMSPSGSGPAAEVSSPGQVDSPSVTFGKQGTDGSTAGARGFWGWRQGWQEKGQRGGRKSPASKQ